MIFNFECWEDGRWFVVLPEWDGDQEDLEMVENADNMLSALTTDGMYSSLDINLEEPEEGDYFTLEIEAHDEDGAFYNVIGCDKFEGTIWLCNVMHFVFGDHPDRLYCKVIE